LKPENKKIILFKKQKKPAKKAGKIKIVRFSRILERRGKKIK